MGLDFHNSVSFVFGLDVLASVFDASDGMSGIHVPVITADLLVAEVHRVISSIPFVVLAGRPPKCNVPHVVELSQSFAALVTGDRRLTGKSPVKSGAFSMLNQSVIFN